MESLFFSVIVISSRFTKRYQCHPSPPSQNFLKDSVFFFFRDEKESQAEDKWSILREKCSNLQKRLENLKKKLDSGDAQQHFSKRSAFVKPGWKNLTQSTGGW